ncbi:unnamed protein product [Xylocopa violacea]|uniref:NADH dehydrogenase [ubiquinone] 1 beta subcomplex subunit 2, mitochondrial n=1 Tax=Xylocopa violacea TaxID=135666 RepID=A0ABP1PIT7_XYLVO
MLLSRSVPLARNVYHFSRKKQVALNLNQIRTEWCYRRIKPVDKTWKLIGNTLEGIIWWWVFWNAYYDYHLIIGEFPYPKPKDWSDEDLGIPED